MTNDELEAYMNEKRQYAEAMRQRITSFGPDTVGLDDKDWVILRLLYVLYKEGRNADESEAHQTIRWFNSQHDGYGPEVMLAAFSRLAGENRVQKRKMYSPYWKESGWE